MTRTIAIRRLDEARGLPIARQQEERATIIEAFRAFWRGNPAEAVFAQHTSGLVLTPEMLYIMMHR